VKITAQLETLLAEMREESSTGRHWADKLEEVVFAAAPEPAGPWAEMVVDRPNASYRDGFSDGFARGVEYGRALAQLGKP
jgi:hypothetical protein